MEKYLFKESTKINHQNQIFCVDDYGVEGEIIQKKWYNIITENITTFTLKNEWGETMPYSKERFRIQKQNLPYE